MSIRALCWNIFHGRDAPPDPSLFTLRSKLLRITERDGMLRIGALATYTALIRFGALIS